MFQDRQQGGGMGYGAPREEHEITCSKCGNKGTVPFKPMDGKPVFCRDCFREERASRGGGGGGYGGGGRRF